MNFPDQISLDPADNQVSLIPFCLLGQSVF